ncbi:hypothetical protein PR048_025408 [Dryococelus australis]|uniref:Integrase zinc-binding domain-containing protein n=1 Tax=Dryococelus australis TaxID=614101 RepID=A0ABQ9GRB3_9NEOP|nr:hypothetical protein PR048_025408 [Dryococelus australis]
MVGIVFVLFPTDFNVEKDEAETSLGLIQRCPELFVQLHETQTEDISCLQVKSDIAAGIAVPYVERDGNYCCYLHDFVFGGHLGVNNTFRKISVNFARPSLKTDESEYVRTCGDCQNSKQAKQTKCGQCNTL